jgi:aspartyl-tRNA(Asn)/glutamyl-tRNA(Gln) amidotransferase subunit A
MTERELAFLTIAQAARLVRARRLSPVELVEAHLARTERLDGPLGSAITVTRELALVQAREAAEDVARGRVLGPLHGIPITYKDIVATAGVRTTAASRVLKDWVPGADAAIVRRMRAAGAVTVGKAALSEFTFAGGSTPNDFVKAPRNPWNLAHQAGGSSNGSAVGVAAGLAMASVGSDSGGSIRIPAAFCGVTGVKPTYGRVTRAGVIPLSFSLDHLGPITRSVEDAALMLDAMCGPDPSDRTTLAAPATKGSFTAALAIPSRGLRVGRLSAYVDAVGIGIDTAAALDAAFDVFRSLGMSIQEVRVPHLAYASAAGYNTIMRAEAFQHHFPTLRDRRAEYGAAFRNIARGGFITAHDYLRAQSARTLIGDEVRAAFEGVDLLALPVTAVSPGGGSYAHEGSDAKVRKGSISHGAAYTAPFNLTGSPALSVPCGFNGAGVPIGLQLVGRAFDENTVLAAAHHYQRATDWHLRRHKETP